MGYIARDHQEDSNKKETSYKAARIFLGVTTNWGQKSKSKRLNLVAPVKDGAYFYYCAAYVLEMV